MTTTLTESSAHLCLLLCPPLYVAESDARHGGFDFRAAHAEADPDLQELLDSHESLPFRYVEAPITARYLCAVLAAVDLSVSPSIAV